MSILLAPLKYASLDLGNPIIGLPSNLLVVCSLVTPCIFAIRVIIMVKNDTMSAIFAFKWLHLQCSKSCILYTLTYHLALDLPSIPTLWFKFSFFQRLPDGSKKIKPSYLLVLNIFTSHQSNHLNS